MVPLWYHMVPLCTIWYIFWPTFWLFFKLFRFVDKLFVFSQTFSVFWQTFCFFFKLFLWNTKTYSKTQKIQNNQKIPQNIFPFSNFFYQQVGNMVTKWLKSSGLCIWELVCCFLSLIFLHRLLQICWSAICDGWSAICLC